RLTEVEGALSLAKAFEEIMARVDDPMLDDAAFRTYVRSLAEKQKPRQFGSRAAAARWILSEPNNQVRSLLNEMQRLDIDAEPHDPGKDRGEYLNRLYKKKTTALPDQ